MPTVSTNVFAREQNTSVVIARAFLLFLIYSIISIRNRNLRCEHDKTDTLETFYLLRFKHRIAKATRKQKKIRENEGNLWGRFETNDGSI